MLIEGIEKIKSVKHIFDKYESSGEVPIHVTTNYIRVGIPGEGTATLVTVDEALLLEKAGFELNTSAKVWQIPRTKLLANVS